MTLHKVIQCDKHNKSHLSIEKGLNQMFHSNPFILFFFLSVPCGMRDLSSLTPEINPGPLELGVQSFNHWTTMEVLIFLFSIIKFYFSDSPGGPVAKA